MTNRLQSLDALRGLAILMVVLSHEPGATWTRVGSIGVDLFFVLSGLLISDLLFSEYKRSKFLDIKRFWVRRAFKIYPPFYLLLACTAVFFAVKNHFVPRQLINDAFFLQGYKPHVWEHGWSLAVEEHFYFTLPLLLMLLIRLGLLRQLPLISIVISITCLVMRIFVSHHTTDWKQIAFPTHLRCDGLFAGVVLGYYRNFDTHSVLEASRRWIPLAGVVLVVCGLLLPLALELTFLYCGFAFVVAWAAQKGVLTVLKPLVWIGFHSYSIYVWYPVAVLICKQSQILYLLTSLLIGITMSKVVEVPALSFRDRMFPKATRPHATADEEFAVRLVLAEP